MNRFRHVWRVLVVLLILAALITWEVRRQQSLQKPPPKVARSLAGCPEELPRSRPARDSKGLVDVTDTWSLEFQHIVGPLGTYFMPESIGAGGALADFNGDGRLDLFLVNSGASPKTRSLPRGTHDEDRLFLQGSRHTLLDATARSGFSDNGYSAGCAVADVNNDGILDVFITNYGQDELYLGQKDGQFVNVTREAGFSDSDWGTAAVFFDYDRDGWLDLAVVNYTADPQYGHSVACGFRDGLVSYCGPHKFQPTVDRLYHNDGVPADGSAPVHFTDVTQASGLSTAPTFGLGLVCADLTGDGWPDMFVANDAAPNRLWVNQQNGTFIDEAVLRGVAVNAAGQPEAGMGVAIGDINRDGQFDLAITHLTGESTTLYLSAERGMFVDATKAAGLRPLTNGHTGWGTEFVDLDLDGNLDLPIVNGLVVPCHSGFPFHGEDKFQVRSDEITNERAFWRDYSDENRLLMGRDDGTFVADDELGADFTRTVGSGRSLICGDLDEDGDVDLVVTYCGERARIFRNDLPRRGHGLTVRAWDPARQRDSLGAVITVVAGGREFVGLMHAGGSYLSSRDPRAFFGLGAAATVDRIEVRWPDGPVGEALEVFPGGPSDQYVVLRRGTGEQRLAR